MAPEQELRQAGQLLDPVPARLMADAVEMFSWRTIDAELAELAFDSAGAQAAAAVRGAEPPRLLTFEAAELSIELELTGKAAERAITGRLIPAQRAGIEIPPRRPAAHRDGRRPRPLRGQPQPDQGRSACASDWKAPTGLRPGRS